MLALEKVAIWEGFNGSVVVPFHLWQGGLPTYLIFAFLVQEELILCLTAPQIRQSRPMNVSVAVGDVTPPSH